MRRNLGAMVSAMVFCTLACLSPASAQEQFISAWADAGPYGHGNIQQVGHMQPKLAPCYGDDCDVCDYPPMNCCPPQACPPGHRKPCGKGLCDLLGGCCSGALAQYTRYGAYCGVGFALVRPHWESNPAFEFTQGLLLQDARTQVADFEYPFKVSPRFFCGYEDTSTGLGMRGDFFYYDHNADAVSFNLDQTQVDAVFFAPFQGANPAIIDIPGAQVDNDQIRLHNSLEMQVADLAMTKRYGGRDCHLTMLFGGRYAYVKQDYRGQLLGDQFGLPIESQTLYYRNRFEGWGPVMGADVVFPAKVGWISLYGNFKYSILIGDNDQSTQFNGVFTDITDPMNPVTTTVSNTTTFTQEDLINIGEGEFGFELYYHTPMILMTIRSGVLFQTWADIGNAVDLDQNLSMFGWTTTVMFSR